MTRKERKAKAQARIKELVQEISVGISGKIKDGKDFEAACKHVDELIAAKCKSCPQEKHMYVLAKNEYADTLKVGLTKTKMDKLKEELPDVDHK